MDRYERSQRGDIIPWYPPFGVYGRPPQEGSLLNTQDFHGPFIPPIALFIRTDRPLIEF